MTSLDPLEISQRQKLPTLPSDALMPRSESAHLSIEEIQQLIPPELPAPTGSQVKLIRTARETDLPYIRHLYRQNTQALGFMPEDAIRKYIELRGVFVGTLNSQECSYLVMQPAGKDLAGVASIHQACVQYDARRRAVGAALVAKAIATARSRHSGILQLWCRSRLESNGFWIDAGFTPVALRQGGADRGDIQILWRLPTIVGANIAANLPTRRRSEAGDLVAINDPVDRLTIIQACRDQSTQILPRLLQQQPPASLKLSTSGCASGTASTAADQLEPPAQPAAAAA